MKLRSFKLDITSCWQPPYGPCGVDYEIFRAWVLTPRKSTGASFASSAAGSLAIITWYYLHTDTVPIETLLIRWGRRHRVSELPSIGWDLGFIQALCGGLVDCTSFN